MREFRLDLEAIPLPETVELDGAMVDVGRSRRAVLGWSAELEKIYKQIEASPTEEAANAATIEFEGSTYSLPAFNQDARGEFYSAISNLLRDLGVDPARLGQSTSP
jgi:hypothetical protein